MFHGIELPLYQKPYILTFPHWRLEHYLRAIWDTASRAAVFILPQTVQYFGHLMQRFDSLEKTLMLGGIGSRRRRG